MVVVMVVFMLVIMVCQRWKLAACRLCIHQHVRSTLTPAGSGIQQGY